MTEVPTLSTPGAVGTFWMHLNSTSTSDEVIAAEAQRRRVIVLNSWESDYLGKIKTANPNCLVLCYKDLFSTRDYAVSGGVDDADLPTGVGYIEAQAHPDWFLRDADGDEQIYTGYAGHVMMDVGNAGYQAAWAANVVADLTAKGFDGVLADNAVFEYDIYGNASPLYTTDEAMKLAFLEMLEVVYDAFEDAGLLLLANASNMRTQPGTWARYMEFLHGALDEWWLAFGTGSLLPDYDQGWHVQVDQVAENEAAGKLTLTQPHYDDGDTTSMRFALASYLCAAGNRTAYSSIAATDGYGNPSPWIPEYEWELGTPDGPYYSVQTGVFRRDFSGGCVVVNANATATGAVTVPLGGTYQDATGADVTSVSLSGTRGAILRGEGSPGSEEPMAPVVKSGASAPQLVEPYDRVTVTVAVGDTIVAFASNENAAGAITSSGAATTGWTAIASVGTGYTQRSGAWVTTATAAGSLTVIRTASGAGSVHAFVIDGEATVYDFATGSGAASASQAISGLDLPASGGTVLGAWFSQFSNTGTRNYTAATGLTVTGNLANAGPGYVVSAAGSGTPAGSSFSSTASISTAPSLGWTGILVALASPIAPATVLDIGSGADDNHFSLQYAIPGEANISTASLAEIEGGFSAEPWFHTTADGQRVHFQARLDAPATSGTTFARSELREVDASGANTTWNPGVGEHVMGATTIIEHLPPVDPELVIAQVYGETATADVVSIRTQLVSGTIRLRVRINGSSVTSPQMASPYVVGTEFAWEIRFVDGDLEVRWAFGGAALPGTPQITSSAVTDTACYFKVGAYNQANESSDSATEYGAAEHRALSVSHSAPSMVEIVVESARAATAATSPLLAQRTALAVDDARTTTRTSQALLAQHSDLGVHDASAAARATRPLLTVPMRVDSARAATRVSSPLLAQSTTVVVGGARAATAATAPQLDQHTALVVDAARAESRATAPTLGQVAGELNIASARSASRATSPTLTQHSVLVVGGARAATAASVPELSATSGIMVDGARAESSASRPLLTAPGVLVVRSARAGSSASAPLLEQRQVLTVAAARAGSSATAPLLAQRVALTVLSARAEAFARRLLLGGVPGTQVRNPTSVQIVEARGLAAVDDAYGQLLHSAEIATVQTEAEGLVHLVPAQGAVFVTP